MPFGALEVKLISIQLHWEKRHATHRHGSGFVGPLITMRISQVLSQSLALQPRTRTAHRACNPIVPRGLFVFK